MSKDMICSCGKEMTRVVGTVSHMIFKHEVNIHNTPHFICEWCGDSEYDLSEVNVMIFLREAYLNKVKDIDYQL